MYSKVYASSLIVKNRTCTLEYWGLLALHDFSGGGALGTNAVFQHLHTTEQPLLQQSVTFNASIAVQITPTRPIFTS
jgi:hypothetical protein